MKRRFTPGGSQGTPARKKRRVTTWTVSSAPALSKSHRLLKTKQQVTLRYGAQIPLLGAVAGAAKSHVFSCNGLYDPDITGIGHQPRGFDQLMKLYDHYVVKKATIEVWVKNGGNAAMIGVQVKDDATTSADFKDMIEDEYSIIKGSNAAAGDVGGDVAYVRFSVDVAKFLGGADIGTLKGSASANPGEMCDFHVVAFPIDPVDTVNLDCVVKITYQADLMEPKQPVSS